MKFKIDKKILELFPTYREGILIVSGFTQPQNSDASYQFLDEVTNKIRRTQKFEEILETNPWPKAFEQVIADFRDCDPSHIALLRRIFDTFDLPNINVITNAINAVQLKVQLPIGAHDLDKIEGDVTVGFNEKSFIFTPRNSEGEESVIKDEIVHADEKSVLTRKWCWKQGRKDLCDNDTNSFVIFLNSLSSKDELEEIAQEIVSILKKYSTTEISTKFDVLSDKQVELDTEKMKDFKVTKAFNFKSHNIHRDKEIIDRILNKAVEEILPSKEKLKDLLLSGKRIKVYQGFDPTAPTLHIGHSVMMRKLEDFRKLGHEVIMLIGDFTGRIGDPSDKGSARKVLTESQVNENLKLYKEQASSLLDIDNPTNPVKVVFNNEWLGKLTFSEIIGLASHFTVQQMIKRDMFQKRLEEDKPIYLHEFLYPLMQGYDSVALNVDIEVGGNDQFFNMLSGRTLSEKILKKNKIIIAGKLLTTGEGKKMGKTEGNMIMLSDTPENIYGKVMAFTDDQIIEGFELLTSMELEDIRRIDKELINGSNPMEYKKKLAWNVVSELKGDKSADKAKVYFETVFQKKSYETEIETIIIDNKPLLLIDLFTKNSICKSKSEARRLIEQGAVYINNNKLTNWNTPINLKNGDVLKVGRKVVKMAAI